MDKSEVESWCAVMSEREQRRTFARDDLAPGNPAARKAQGVMIEVIRLTRAALAAGL